MAYVINSDKDKKKEEKTKNRTPTKNISVSTDKSSGETSISTPTTTSSGASPSNNSQYTNLGGSWDANTDYSAIIEDAVASGDYRTAAQAEQLRNQKIAETGSEYSPTNRFSGWLDDTDYYNIGMSQMANGANWRDVQKTYNSRYNKAAGTEGLEQYANDEFQQTMLAYINNQKAREESQNWQNEWERNNAKPVAPQSDPRIDKLLTQILKRDDFSYDAESDPLYQQYAQMYLREGDRAARDVLAETAASAGGMNTWAVTAAQQANSYYNSQLADKIPELFQLAYEMYLDDKVSKVEDLGLLQSMDNTQYNRYRDTVNDWYSDKDFAYNAYHDAIQQGNWQTNFDYNAAINNRDFNYNAMWDEKTYNNENYWKEREHIADRADVDFDKNNITTENAQTTLLDMMNMCVIPEDDELIAQAGWTRAEVESYVANKRAELASKGIVLGGSSAVASGGTSSGGSSGGGSSSGGGKSSSSSDNGWTGESTKTETKTETPKSNNEVKDVSSSAILSLGIGSVSDDTVAQLALAGAVAVKNDGTVYWINGYNPSNWQTALNKENAF